MAKPPRGPRALGKTGDTMKRTDENRIYVRPTDNERAELEKAAEADGRGLGPYVLRAALLKARGEK